RGREARGASGGRAILDAAVAVVLIAQARADELDQAPLVVAVVPHVLVAVGHRPARDQDEAVARVAEALLEAAPQGARDPVARDRRVAVVRDPRDRAGVALRRAE